MREKLLETMREDYKNKDLKSLKRHFLMSQWMLTDEDKGKITKAISTLEHEVIPEALRYAHSLLGGEIVDKE